MIIVGIIVTSIAICLNIYLFSTRKKVTEKVGLLREFSREKAIVLGFWKASNHEILYALQAIEAKNAYHKGKLNKSKNEIKLLGYEIVLLTEKENPLEVERALGYLSDRVKSSHLTLLKISKKNVNGQSPEWNNVRNLTNTLIDKINNP